MAGRERGPNGVGKRWSTAKLCRLTLSFSYREVFGVTGMVLRRRLWEDESSLVSVERIGAVLDFFLVESDSGWEKWHPYILIRSAQIPLSCRLAKPLMGL
jgi:hypothetical protein